MGTVRKDDAPRRDLATRVEEQSERIASLSRELDTTSQELAKRDADLKATVEDATRLRQELVDLRTGSTNARRMAQDLAEAREALRVAEDALAEHSRKPTPTNVMEE